MTDIPTRLSQHIARAVAIGGTATIYIRDHQHHIVTSLDVEDGLAVASVVSTDAEAKVYFKIEDLVAVITTDFQEPA